MKGAALLESLSASCAHTGPLNTSGQAFSRRLSRRSSQSDYLLVDDRTHSTHGNKREVWLFFNASASEKGVRRWAAYYEGFSVSVVIVLVVLDILCSMPEFDYMTENSLAYLFFERFACALFSVEYTLRLWSCVEAEEYLSHGMVLGRLRWASTLLAMVDFFVLVAMYVDLFSSLTSNYIQVIRMVRLLRVVALLKVERKTNSFKVIYMVLKAKNAELVATVFTAAVLMVMSSTLMYQIENSSQPEAFDSIVSAMWWSVTALTTVGYGDIYPQTALGKMVGSIVAFIGVGLFALPAGILGSGFVEKMQEEAQLEQESFHEDLSNAVDSEAERTQKMITTLASIQSSIFRTEKEVAQMQSEMQQAKDTRNGEMREVRTALLTMLSNQAAIFQQLESLQRAGSPAPLVLEPRERPTEEPPSTEQRLGEMPSFNLTREQSFETSAPFRAVQPAIPRPVQSSGSSQSSEAHVHARPTHSTFVPAQAPGAEDAFSHQTGKVFNKPRQPPNWNT